MLVRITRRSLLALTGLAVAAPQAMTAPAMHQPRTVRLLRCPVAGLAYYDYARAANALALGTPLVLRRQPDNPHDRKAIEVLTEGGIKLGYVPRADNAAVASLMDAGYAMRAEIADIGHKVWPLRMVVRMVERSAARS